MTIYYTTKCSKVTSICHSYSSICFRDGLHSSSTLSKSRCSSGIYRLYASVYVFL